VISLLKGRQRSPIFRTKVLKSASFSLGSFFGLRSAQAEGEDNHVNSMSFPDERSEDEWRAVLSPEQFRVLREKGTERPFTGEYDKQFPDEGVFNCAACDAPLYRAKHKFNSGCGWPAYYDSIPGAVSRHVDQSFGMERTEIVCSNCGGHLGHVFKGESYPTETGERHCVNSISLKFTDEQKVGVETSDAVEAATKA
jgi:peptide-methionine (R)-S-oxide reductase